MNPRLRGLVLAALAAVACASCLKRPPEPYLPDRPMDGPGGNRVRAARAHEPFPERRLIAARSVLLGPHPNVALAEVEAVYRSIRSDAALPRTGERMAALDAEIDTIRAALGDIGIHAGALLRQRLGGTTSEDEARFRAAAGLYVRWGLALMRTGLVEDRIAGAERLAQAAMWDPENPIPEILLSTYEDQAGFTQRSLERLERFSAERGSSDLVDLARIRRQERAYRMGGYTEALASAYGFANASAARRGGWDEAPAWLSLERAVLHFLADSLGAAHAAATEALEREDPADTLTSVEARLMLGVIETRRIDYTRAAALLDEAARLAARNARTAELAAWLTVPWEQWTREQQRRYDQDPARAERVELYWAANDPIWATPGVMENRVEYQRRVGEAFFAFSGLDPLVAGPLTQPGAAVLRFGWPNRWEHLGARDAFGAPKHAILDFSVYQTWQFDYVFVGERGRGSGGRGGAWEQRRIYFQARPGTGRFESPDSLAPPLWPQTLFNYDFLGRGYVYNTAAARFRDPRGGTRIWVSADTYLPEYAVRYPLQGLRWEGEARLDLTLYHARLGDHRRAGRRNLWVDADLSDSVAVRAAGKINWISGARRSLALDAENALMRTYLFRRRAGMVSFSGLEPGQVRIASLLTLRGKDGRVDKLGVDNGDTLYIREFEQHKVDASDLLLLGTYPDELPASEVTTLAPGIHAFGTSVEEVSSAPRAGRLLLSGEGISYYFEVYNLPPRAEGDPAPSFTDALEKLTEEGDLEYSISVGGTAQTLTRRAATQWNVYQSLGFQDLTPGLYRLVIRITAGTREFTRFALFRVVEPEDIATRYRWAELERPER